MSLETFYVKTETEVCVKEEAEECDIEETSAHVIEECEDSAALCELYTEHQIKEELVLGPVQFHQPCIPCIPSSLPATLKTIKEARGDRVHTDETLFKCSHCDYKCKKKYLLTHTRIHTAEKLFKCSKCDYKGRRKSDLVRHERIHTGEKLFKCSDCDYKGSKKIYFLIHKRIHTGEQSFKSSQCDNNCRPKSNLLGLPERPLEIINGNHSMKNLLATESDSRQQENKNKQVFIEDDPTKFVCKVCLKNYRLQRLLNRHMRCHSEVKRYVCTVCGKGFNDAFDLKRHTRTHTGVKPYKCHLCEQSFSQRRSLENHYLSVHRVQHTYAYKERRTKMYVCEDCGHSTIAPEKHHMHLLKHHPDSPALLKLCDKRCFKSTNFTSRS